MTQYDQLVAAYEVDVRFPDVSGMEHLEMLRTRSDIAWWYLDVLAQLPDLSPQGTSGLAVSA